MADEKTHDGPADPAHVSLDEEYEVWYWVKEFGVTQSELEQAVQAVGSSAEKVREHLRHVHQGQP